MKTTLVGPLVLGLAGFVVAFYPATTVKAAKPETVTPHIVTPQISEERTPAIQFRTNFYDFGKLIAPGFVSGVFKFKNVGTGILKVAPPVPSCGCTDAKVKPNTLAPGESGVITYSIKLDHAMGQVQKRISVYSNDPKTPEVQLTVQLNYMPLYELNPLLLQLQLAANQDAAKGNFTIVRNDGKPVGIKRLITSQKWISATLAPSSDPQASLVRVNVTVHRPEDPAPILMGNVQVWADHQTNRPVQTLFLSCQIQGQLTATPSRMYWVIPDFGNTITNYPTTSLTRTVRLKSVLGNPVKIESVTTSIEGLSTRIVPQNGKKTFDLILKFNQLPQGFSNGNVTIKTSSASLPELKVPIIVSVAPK